MVLSVPPYAEDGQISAELWTKAGPGLVFVPVPEAKQAKNRVHIDLVDPDLGAVDKLVRLGAIVIGSHQIRGHRWTVLQDPEGNEFCIAAKSFTGLD